MISEMTEGGVRVTKSIIFMIGRDGRSLSSLSLTHSLKKKKKKGGGFAINLFR